MPWRLIQFILIFGIFLVFAGMNLKPENSCIINLGFKSIEVLVFFPVFFSFILGMLCSLPYVIKMRLRNKNGQSGDDRKLPGSRKKNKNDTPDMPEDSTYLPGGPYGVN